MRTYVFELVITHTVLILAYYVLLSRERQYHKMRFYLLVSTLFSIVLPLFRLPKLFSTELQPVPQTSTVINAPVSPTAVASPEVSLITFETIMWFSMLISGVFLLKLITSIIYLIRLERQSTNASYENINVKIVRHTSESFTFFKWVFLSSEIDEHHKDIEAILKHEQAHANLGHSYDLLFFEIYKALFWWLPSSWYIKREIKIIHEYQADACALRSLNIDLYTSILIKSPSNPLNSWRVIAV